MNVYAFRNKREIEQKSSSGGAFYAVVEAAFNIFGGVWSNGIWCFV